MSLVSPCVSVASVSVKPQMSSFFAPAPGQLFTPAPAPGQLFTQSPLKLDPPSSNDTWKFLQSLTMDSQPKPAAFPSPSVPQDFPTVNLSDLQDFPLSSFITPEQISTTGTAAAPQDTFSDELPEFPSFSEVQGSDVDNINIEDFQALLGQSCLPGEARPAEDPTGTGSTWMSFPPSIASLIQSESMMESAAPAAPAVLDDLEVLNSIDDDRSCLSSPAQTRWAFCPDTPPRTLKTPCGLRAFIFLKTSDCNGLVCRVTSPHISYPEAGSPDKPDSALLSQSQRSIHSLADQ